VSDGNQTSNRCCSACGASSRTNQAPESRCSSEKKKGRKDETILSIGSSDAQQWMDQVQ
jgi:hypothetical protein